MTRHSPIGAGDERWPRIAVGFTLASLAAGYTVVLAIFSPLGLTSGYLPSVGAYLLIGFLFFILIGLLAALPAVYVISLAEQRRWRSAACYAAAGAGVALVCAGGILLLTGGVTALTTAPHGARALVAAVPLLGLPGVVGGLVYWSIAGRSAGSEP